MEHWRLVETDLHEVYGIDVDDDELMAARTWRWLRARVLSLLDKPATFVPINTGESVRLVAVPTTRLGCALYPPDFSDPQSPTPTT